MSGQRDVCKRSKKLSLPLYLPLGTEGLIGYNDALRNGLGCVLMQNGQVSICISITKEPREELPKP